jgi:hypothetical protein
MVEFFECFLGYVAWHGDVDVSFIIVPVKGETAVKFSDPFDSQVVVGFDGVDEMRGVGCVKVFHAEGERGALHVMAPEAWSEWHGFVSGRLQFLDELVESEDAGFFEAIHTATDFEVDVAVAGDGNGVSVIVPDFFQNDGWADAYVLEVCHGCAEVAPFLASEMVLLMRNLASSMETAGELASPG